MFENILSGVSETYMELFYEEKKRIRKSGDNVPSSKYKKMAV
jgi:hypothetical protein